MTVAQLILVASVAGAILFFAAGAAFVALRQRDRTVHHGAHQPTETERALNAEIARLREELERAETTVRNQPTTSDEQNRLFGLEATNDHATSVRDLDVLKERASRAELADREAKRLHEEAARLRGDAERLRSDGQRHRAEAERLRAEVERLRAELAHLREQASAATGTVSELQRVADDRATQLERARSETSAATTELSQVQSKLRDIERQLAAKSSTARDLATENEQLKGRLRDAEALRSEYVRLRTATTDSEYLRSEIARLEQELRDVRVTALGPRGLPQRPRPARGTDRNPNASEHTISESLANVIERFTDAGTRSIAVGDLQGFPLASAGTDGLALAAYAALLNESAARAREYLPVGAPSAIEIVDANGVRVSVWSLAVESERLLLANLAVSPVDAQRVESALVDLTQILAPATARASGARR